MNNDLLNFIEQARKSGMRDDQIRQELLQRGWLDADINEALMGGSATVPGLEAKPAVRSLTKTLIKIIAVVLVIAVLGAAGYFGRSYYMPQVKTYYSKLQNQSFWPFKSASPVTTPTPSPSQSLSPIVTPPVMGIPDCGLVNMVGTNYDQNSTVAKNCFDQKFSKCEPAKAEFALPDIGLKYYYEITGPNGNYCFVKSKFLLNPNPNWINKEMLCSLDQRKDFETAVKDTRFCSGELYNLMTGK